VGDIALTGAGRRVAAYSDTADSRLTLRRANAKRKLRLGLVAATIGLFVTAWGFTNHSPANQASAAPASTTSPSNPGFFPSTNDGSNNNSSSGQGQFSPGSIFGQPSQGGPNTSTGVS
jgi:hypothetical protein